MKQLAMIERATTHADRTALRTETNQHTYDELVSHSESVAASLLQANDDLEESRIAYLVPAGFQYVATLWGIFRAGGIAVPLSLSATSKEVEYTLTDSQASCVVTTRQLAPKVSSLCELLHRRVLIIDDVDDSSQAKLPEISPDRRAMILYTSGTTSKPKGVVTTHACMELQIVSLVDAWQWQPDDRIPLFLPLHHIHGIINIMSCALWTGAEIEPFARFDIDVILQRVSDDAYSVFMAVPTIYVKLIESLGSMTDTEVAPIIDGFGKMRLMISGSAALPASVHQQWTELTGQKLLERYGMTEIGMALSNPYEGERRPGAVGQPLPGVEIRLVADATAEGVIPEQGEIQVRGKNVFLEYWNRPDVTRDSFRDGWFRTGDIAVLENGYYRIMGRNSVDIIKSGGYKLSALEIEATLLDHPAISECAVVGIPDDTWGESVAAAAVMKDKDEEQIDLKSLREWCRDRMSAYKIPRELLIVEQLPRNAMGKVTKPDVQKLFQPSQQ